MANKFLGQHFLNDPSTVRRILSAIAPSRGDLVVEIGPGHGELTIPLARALKEAGGEMIAVEKDPSLAERLAESLKSAGFSNVRMKIGDAIDFLGAANGDFKLVGNIPYYLTGRLFRAISGMERKPRSCVLMLQKEVAERIVAEPPRMNRLAASVRFWGAPKILFAVPRDRFKPKPKVDSAVIKIEARGTPVSAATGREADAYYAAMRALFAHPRKTILNNLVSAGAGLKKENASSALAAAGIDPSSRPQNLSVEAIKTIARMIVEAAMIQ